MSRLRILSRSISSRAGVAQAGDAADVLNQPVARARGTTRDTMLANSHDNIARIFAAPNKFEQALQNFRWAKNYKSNPVGGQSIARTNEKQGR